MIPKSGSAPNLHVQSPVGDSQSNGREENAIKKVRNMVKTTFSSLESKWCIRVKRDHPVYPWMFEWAADLMTRLALVGQLIRGSKSSRNVAQTGEKILYKPLKLSGHHRGNMEDTFLDCIFLGMILRSDEIILGTTRGVIKTRTLRRRVEEEQWDNEFARSIKGEPRQPVPGINRDHVLTAVSDRAGVLLEEDQADARLEQQDEDIDPLEAREVSVNTTPHSSNFRTNHMHTHGSSVGPHSLHHILLHAHCVSVVSDCSHFDNSTFLSLLSIFSLITLSFLLPVNFIFQDVVDKFPVHFRQ